MNNADVIAVEEDIFGDIDKMICDIQTNVNTSQANESVLNIESCKLSFRHLKRAINRAEKCGHKEQDLNMFDGKTVFFHCAVCDKKTFVDNNNTEVPFNAFSPFTSS